MKRLIAVCAVAALCTLSFGGCKKEKNDDPVTAGEAINALSESSISSQAISLTGTSIELTTDFTIGQAAAAAAAEIATFIESQLPCAEITITGAELEVSYGAISGNCVYNGHTYEGIHRVTVVSAEEGQLEIEHEWDAFTNGEVMVSGSASVTWGFDGSLSRNVEHDLTWTNLVDMRSGHDTGTRLQEPHPDGGLAVGLRVEGERSWEGENGVFTLVEDDVQFRWEDPLPDNGKYTLTLPNKKSMSMSFSRVDADTIEVLIESGNKSFAFNVSKAGAIEQTAGDSA